MGSNKKAAFTLIELLIVIVIIGILAGVVLAVINPAQQITRAKQSVIRGAIVKACLAHKSCMTANNDAAAQCDTQAKAGYDFSSIDNASGVFSPSGTTTGRPAWTFGDSSNGCVIACTLTGAVTVTSSGTVTCAIQ